MNMHIYLVAGDRLRVPLQSGDESGDLIATRKQGFGYSRRSNTLRRWLVTNFPSVAAT